MKNSNDTNGNRTRDIQACSAVPQPCPSMLGRLWNTITVCQIGRGAV